MEALPRGDMPINIRTNEAQLYSKMSHVFIMVPSHASE